MLGNDLTKDEIRHAKWSRGWSGKVISVRSTPYLASPDGMLDDPLLYIHGLLNLSKPL